MSQSRREAESGEPERTGGRMNPEAAAGTDRRMADERSAEVAKYDLPDSHFRLPVDPEQPRAREFTMSEGELAAFRYWNQLDQSRRKVV